MFTAASMSTSAPLAISNTRINGSCNCLAARLLRRGLCSWVATTSDPRSQREVSMSWTQVSTMTPSVVTLSGTAGLPGAEGDHHRATVFPAVECLLHRPVTVVIAAHEPDHDQTASRGYLGIEDPLARFLGGREGLLAE